MVDQALQDDDIGIDLESYREEQDDQFDDSVVDLEQYAKQSKSEPTWLETIGDIFTQTGRGALKYFTWPADVLKLGMIGEGLSDLDELEEVYRKEGKPFDREDYVRKVFETAQYIPTQELAEKGFEELTGISLQPKTELGKGAKQLTEIAAFTPGGVAKKVISGAIGAATTQGLKSAGVGEGKAEVIGDVASLSPALLEKIPRQLSKVALHSEKVAQKNALPFLELMARDRQPIIKGRLFSNTEKRIQDQFNLSSKQALGKIVRGDLPIARLRDRGINIDSLGEYAYAETRKLAQKNNHQFNTDKIVGNIDNEISRIKSLAPSPSDSQKAAIKLLEDERDILKVSNPTPEQLINQHMNYNADMKSLYRKPEFSGKEEQVRKTYEFLKDQLVDVMEKQGTPDVANAFKAANKIYHEKSKLYQTESLLNKAFDGETYSPKKLDRLLQSKQGNFLRRNLSKSAIEDIEEIAKYGKEAQEKMKSFIDLKSSSVANEIKSWGQLGWAIFLPHNLKGAALVMAKPLATHIQGKLLTRPATRETYKLTLKHAADGSFNLLKKDFMQLEKEISKEWGSVDDFMDDMMDDLETYE